MNIKEVIFTDLKDKLVFHLFYYINFSIIYIYANILELNSLVNTSIYLDLTFEQ